MLGTRIWQNKGIIMPVENKAPHAPHMALPPYWLNTKTFTNYIFQVVYWVVLEMFQDSPILNYVKISANITFACYFLHMWKTYVGTIHLTFIYTIYAHK